MQAHHAWRSGERVHRDLRTFVTHTATCTTCLYDFFTHAAAHCHFVAHVVAKLLPLCMPPLLLCFEGCDRVGAKSSVRGVLESG
jgi:hypothetical protein